LIAPSQSAAAVAGVQKLLRQQSSLLPFFQTSSELPLRQLSIDCAPAAEATAMEAKSIATLFKFFMVLLREKLGSVAAIRGGRQAPDPRPPLL
jgi:hypothetical protein